MDISGLSKRFHHAEHGSGVSAGGVLYNPGYDGTYMAISESNGTQLWDTITERVETEMPHLHIQRALYQIAGGKIFTLQQKATKLYLYTEDTGLYAYDIHTGAQLLEHLWGILHAMQLMTAYY